MTRWTSDVIERRHSLPGIEPGALGLSSKTLRPPLAEDNRSTSAHRNGQGDGIRTRTVRVTGGDAHYYITTLKNGAPGRTRTDDYEFTKLALLLLRHGGKWCSHVDLHHELP